MAAATWVTARTSVRHSADSHGVSTCRGDVTDTAGELPEQRSIMDRDAMVTAGCDNTVLPELNQDLVEPEARGANQIGQVALR